MGIFGVAAKRRGVLDLWDIRFLGCYRELCSAHLLLFEKTSS